MCLALFDLATIPMHAFEIHETAFMQFATWIIWENYKQVIGAFKELDKVMRGLLVGVSYVFIWFIR